VKKVNVFEVATEPGSDDPEGYRNGRKRIGPVLGAEKLGASVWDLPPGQSTCPYHFEAPNEEWVLVLVGHPTLRHPQGEDVLQPGDVVAFPAGPEGAHKLTNATEGPVRILLLSTMMSPDTATYPDSDKVGVFYPDGSGLLFRRSAAVEYYDGER
jgi:uncharacterized cupin superfamily protein